MLDAAVHGAMRYMDFCCAFQGDVWQIVVADSRAVTSGLKLEDLEVCFLAEPRLVPFWAQGTCSEVPPDVALDALVILWSFFGHSLVYEFLFCHSNC